MKRIAQYRTLLGVSKSNDLKEIKSAYRNLMKEWHPDKFQESEEQKQQAEEKSKQFIEAYHFLTSIDPETIAQAKEEYEATISAAFILNFSYEKQILKLSFPDGSNYEYYGVPKNLYTKLCNSDALGRFCRRHIYNEFVYRKINKAVEA